jgi:predicted transposase YbfD/YdcC
MVTTTRRHLFLTSIRTTPETLLRFFRQRWSIENEWHWTRDAQLGGDANRNAQGRLKVCPRGSWRC